MSKEYIKSLNFKNISEFYLFVLEVKNSEVDYIFNILLDHSKELELTDEQFYRWIDKNDRLVANLITYSKENYNRIINYIRYNYPKSYDYFTNKIDFAYCSQKTVIGKLEKIEDNTIVFYIEKEDKNKYAIFNEDEYYVFDIIKASTYYICFKIPFFDFRYFKKF